MATTKAGFPIFQLIGGRYDGLSTVVRDDFGEPVGPIESVAYFPDTVHVNGQNGLQVYEIQPAADDGTRTAKAIGPGS